jgi:hypothetical protein
LALFRSAFGGGRDGDGRGLTAAERDTLQRVLRLGCARSTAAKYVGRSVEQLNTLLAADDELQRDVLRAEAQAEVRHMGNVHKASESEKNWRTSVWWLEQRAAGGDADLGATIPVQVLPVLEAFAEAIIDEVPDVVRRQSLLTRLLHIAVDSVAPPVTIDAEAARVTSPPIAGALTVAAEELPPEEAMP